MINLLRARMTSEACGVWVDEISSRRRRENWKELIKLTRMGKWRGSCWDVASLSFCGEHRRAQTQWKRLAALFLINKLHPHSFGVSGGGMLMTFWIEPRSHKQTWISQKGKKAKGKTIFRSRCFMHFKLNLKIGGSEIYGTNMWMFVFVHVNAESPMQTCNALGKYFCFD